ncbi:hypothetical protein G5I_05927 [Acromyrmex echinatior]|uniref:Uncharacterized protein n=1 Tax=Acromyrmex echinatior TaxID=103372 RepID=F4WJP6_ACREC|nr:hypothetical protein G5I_05927 [Acromyrmex echinatior]
MTAFNVLRLQLPQFLTTPIFHRGPLELSLLVIFVDSSTIVVRAGLADGIARTSLRDFIALVSGVSHESRRASVTREVSPESGVRSFAFTARGSIGCTWPHEHARCTRWSFPRRTWDDDPSMIDRRGEVNEGDARFAFSLGVAATTFSFWPSVRRTDPRVEYRRMRVEGEDPLDDQRNQRRPLDRPRPAGARTQPDATVEFVRANRPLQRGCRTANVNPERKNQPPAQNDNQWSDGERVMSVHEHESE